MEAGLEEERGQVVVLRSFSSNVVPLEEYNHCV
jgi:hypothetical protein